MKVLVKGHYKGHRIEKVRTWRTWHGIPYFVTYYVLNGKHGQMIARKWKDLKDHIDDCIEQDTLAEYGV